MRDVGSEVAIVTGSSGGIGREIVRALAREGRTIVGFDLKTLDKADADALIAGTDATFVDHAGDVGSWDACQKLAADVLERFGRIDILVNNAGTSLPQVRIDQIEEADWRTVMSPTLEGTLFLSRAVLPAMIARRYGCIVNIASMAGIVTPNSFGAYGVSKAGVIQLSRIIATENVRHGIRCNAVCPGATATALSDQSRATLREAAAGGGAPVAAPASDIPVLDRIHPEKVAQIVRLLCSEDASEINASVLQVDQAHGAGLTQTLLIEKSMGATRMI